MRAIARKIEYSPTTIYLYFKDKWDLFHSVCEEAFAKLEHELEAIKKTDDDPVECLRRGTIAYINFGLGHPNHYRVVFLTPHTNSNVTILISSRVRRVKSPLCISSARFNAAWNRESSARETPCWPPRRLGRRCMGLLRC